MTEFLLQSLLVLALILANGFFVAAEMAAVTSSRTRLSRLASGGSRGARAALKLLDAPEGFLATVQIGITLLTILSGAYGEASLAHYATQFLGGVPVLAPYARGLGFALVVGLITLTTIILGELVPKRLAIANPEAIAVRLSPVIAVFMRLFAPLAWFLSAASRLALGLFGADSHAREHVSEEEIRLLVRQAATAGVLDENERETVERVMRLGDTPVFAVMTHRSRVVCLDLEEPEKITETVRATPFNRFPVVRGGFENLLGVAEAKDLLAVNVCKDVLSVLPVLIQPPHVPETSTVFKVLEQLRISGQSLAVVVDEFGDPQGLVTFTDVLRSVVGELALPQRGEEPMIAVRSDGSLLVDGMAPVREVFDRMGEHAPEGDFVTLAGFVLERLGRIPAIADSFEHGRHSFEVVDMDGRRVDRVLVQKLPTTPENEPDSRI